MDKCTKCGASSAKSFYKAEVVCTSCFANLKKKDGCIRYGSKATKPKNPIRGIWY